VWHRPAAAAAAAAAAINRAEPAHDALKHDAEVLRKIIGRSLKLLTRRGALVEEQDPSSMVDHDCGSDDGRTLSPLQASPPDATHDEFDSPCATAFGR